MTVSPTPPGTYGYWPLPWLFRLHPPGTYGYWPSPWPFRIPPRYWRYSRYVILRGIGPKFFADVHNSAMHERLWSPTQLAKLNQLPSSHSRSSPSEVGISLAPQPASLGWPMCRTFVTVQRTSGSSHSGLSRWWWRQAWRVGWVVRNLVQNERIRQQNEAQRSDICDKVEVWKP